MKGKKCILLKEIRDRVLASQEIIGKIADLTVRRNGKSVRFEAVERRFRENAPILTSIESMDVIKQVLGLPPDAIIYEYVDIETPALINN